MARKVFVSYKYSDSLVQDLGIYQDSFLGKLKITTTARHYVDEISEHLIGDDHIYKGENDDESMENLADSSISSRLGDKIFDSSVTIVLISKGMKEPFTSERDQWIPWEVSYSLKKQTRSDRSSSTNGVIAVILPDENGSYEYYITRDGECNCRSLNTPILFQIIRDNMFNVKEPDRRVCNNSWVYSGDSSYIQSVKWSDFIANPTKYIDKAIELRDKKDDFNIVKTIK
ncbi:TIR domain-containing protein [Joostella sp. CR20]|uniref:TIR domain-containing protein n=1 Tax=Joostella sp. CR20 TaxID=2804312 RepID=UPI00313DE344